MICSGSFSGAMLAPGELPWDDIDIFVPTNSPEECKQLFEDTLDEIYGWQEEGCLYEIDTKGTSNLDNEDYPLDDEPDQQFFSVKLKPKSFIKPLNFIFIPTDNWKKWITTQFPLVVQMTYITGIFTNNMLCFEHVYFRRALKTQYFDLANTDCTVPKNYKVQNKYTKKWIDYIKFMDGNLDWDDTGWELPF